MGSHSPRRTKYERINESMAAIAWEDVAPAASREAATLSAHGGAAVFGALSEGVRRSGSYRGFHPHARGSAKDSVRVKNRSACHAGKAAKIQRLSDRSRSEGAIASAEHNPERIAAWEGRGEARVRIRISSNVHDVHDGPQRGADAGALLAERYGSP